MCKTLSLSSRSIIVVSNCLYSSASVFQIVLLPCSVQKQMSSISHRLLLRYGFDQLRSTQVAVVHCSAQTNATQKLSQTCMVLSTNTGRVYRPKDCERLVLYLKDVNLTSGVLLRSSSSCNRCELD